MRNSLGHVVLTPADYALLKSATQRLDRLQLAAGHGNFALMNFEAAQDRARSDPAIGAFSNEEIRFMYRIFHQDAGGFLPGEPGGGQVRGFTYLWERFVPMLEERGLSEGLVERLLVTNPARAFAVRV